MAKKKQRRYDVHLFPAVRVKVTNIPASSHVSAIEAAIAQVDFYQLFQDLKGFETEYGERTDQALVDVVGDEEHKRTMDFNWRERNWLRYDYDKLVEWSEIDDAVRAIEDLKEGTTDDGKTTTPSQVAGEIKDLFIRAAQHGFHSDP